MAKKPTAPATPTTEDVVTEPVITETPTIEAVEQPVVEEAPEVVTTEQIEVPKVEPVKESVSVQAEKVEEVKPAVTEPTISDVVVLPDFPTTEELFRFSEGIRIK